MLPGWSAGDLGDGRDRDGDSGLHMGRGSTSHEKSESDPRDRDEERWPDRERGHDPRDVFTRSLDLPRGREREIVHDRDREYTLRGSESRTLATVGAFRVVSSRDLRDHLEPLLIVSHLSVDFRLSLFGREMRARPGSATTNAPASRLPSSRTMSTIA